MSNSKDIFSMKLAGFAIFYCLIVSCNQQEKNEPAGGGCTYNETSFRFNIIEIRKIAQASANDSISFYDVVATINRDDLEKIKSAGFNEPDTVYFSKYNHGFVDSAFLVSHNMKAGRELHGRVSKIKSGDCDPELVSYNWNE